MGKTRVGVYICHCGVNIGSTVEVSRLARFAATLPHVAVAKDYIYLCSDPGRELIRNDIKELNLNRVVVAACSPRMHEPTFRKVLGKAGLNPYCLEIANIREHCSWVHQDMEKATRKAESILAATVAKAGLLEPLEEKEVDVVPSA